MATLPVFDRYKNGKAKNGMATRMPVSLINASTTSIAMALASPATALKKVSRYCCDECGAKELYLYCWKGCRHVQNLKTFYMQTKQIYQEVETLKATVYAQEVKLRDEDTLVKEKQNCLDDLTQAINHLPSLCDASSKESHQAATLLPPRAKQAAAPSVTTDNDVTVALDRLAQFTQQAKDLKDDMAKLQQELNEKARTTTRLREGFAEVKMALDGKDDEIQRVERKRSHVDTELATTRQSLTSLAAELKLVQSELLIRNTALQDLRTLVEDQVVEKEKWQRYCWELEERLYVAVSSSQLKDRDLWKTKDAKKEEARRNMLLYMDHGMGKKHFVDSHPAKHEEQPMEVEGGDETEGSMSECAVSMS